MVVLVQTKVRLRFLKFQNRSFESNEFLKTGALNKKPVYLICKMLPQTNVSYSRLPQNFAKAQFVVGLSLQQQKIETIQFRK
jgi:hypothetical protein